MGTNKNRGLQWIHETLPDIVGLRSEQQSKKVEMTVSDIVLLLTKLWTRTKDIPCEPRTRVAFHSITAIEGIGGFRLGPLIGMKYGQFNLKIVRDPRIQNKKSKSSPRPPYATRGERRKR
jgi:hypothetical protein